MSDTVRTRGSIRKWFAEKGFGFASIPRQGAPISGTGVRRMQGAPTHEDVFVHVRALCPHLRDTYSKVEVPAVDPVTQRATPGGWADVYIETEAGDRGPRAKSAVCAWCEATPERMKFI